MLQCLYACQGLWMFRSEVFLSGLCHYNNKSFCLLPLFLTPVSDARLSGCLDVLFQGLSFCFSF
jgi:hypothetical protein